MIDIVTTIERHKVFITFVYGDLIVEYREHVWDRLTEMSLTRKGPWLMLGDFNDITGHHEKKSRRKRPDTSFIPFKFMLANCEMIDFPAKGNPLSWIGNRSSGKVQCKLDRAVGNEDWHHIFSHTNVEYLRLWGSDHRPILTRFLSKQGRIRRGFKFEKRWIGKHGLRETILQGWNDPDNLHPPDLYERIAKCRKAISHWKRLNPSNSSVRIEEIKDKLEKAQLNDVISNDVILQLKWDLCAAFRDEELIWKQKSRTNWLREGDRNKKIFHAKKKQRRARNRLTKLKNPREDVLSVKRILNWLQRNTSKFSLPHQTPKFSMKPSGMLPRKLLHGVMRRLLVPHQMRKLKKLCLILTRRRHLALMG